MYKVKKIYVYILLLQSLLYQIDSKIITFVFESRHSTWKDEHPHCQAFYDDPVIATELRLAHRGVSWQNISQHSDRHRVISVYIRSPSTR